VPNSVWDRRSVSGSAIRLWRPGVAHAPLVVVGFGVEIAGAKSFARPLESPIGTPIGTPLDSAFDSHPG
jgi:hypothetical protein